MIVILPPTLQVLELEPECVCGVCYSKQASIICMGCRLPWTWGPGRSSSLQDPCTGHPRRMQLHKQYQTNIKIHTSILKIYLNRIYKHREPLFLQTPYLVRMRCRLDCNYIIHFRCLTRASTLCLQAESSVKNQFWIGGSKRRGKLFQARVCTSERRSRN